MNRYFLLIVALLLIRTVSAQSLIVNGNVVIAESSPEGVKVVIFKNSQKIDEQIITRKGRFDLKLALDSDYKISFEKDGYITKTVTIGTEVPSEILETNPIFPPVKLIINLFPQAEGVDLSIFEQPIAILAYDYELDDFIFDKEYSDKIRDRVAQTEKEVKRVLASRGSAALEKERLFAEWRGKGQNSFDQKQWEEAILNWKKALVIKPENNEVKDKIEIARKEQELDKARRSIELQNAQSYKLLLAKGDSLFHLKKYAEAKEKYNDAIRLNAKDNYPPQKINEINDLLAQLEKQAVDQQKQMAQTEANYQRIILTADNAFQAKEYNNAIVSYRQALEIKSSELYPKEQISRAEKAIAAQNEQLAAQQEKQKQEDLRKAGVKLEYDKIIMEADQAFQAQNYTLAKIRYTDAGGLNIGIDYPSKQLKEIDNIFNSSKYKSKLAEYNQHKTTGDKELQAKNYASAKFYYQKALALLPIDQEVINKQITEIDRLIEAEQLAAINKEYGEHITKADKAYQEKSYAVAKFYYQKALSVKKEDPYAQKQLNEVEKFIGERKEKSVEL